MFIKTMRRGITCFFGNCRIKAIAEKEAPADTEDTRKPGTKKQEIVLL